MTTRWRRVFAQGKHRKVWLRALVAFFSVWLIIGVATFAISGPNKVYLVPTGSMAPTIRPGDRVAVRAGVAERPQRGEIWVFHMPRASGNAPNEAIKRIVGLPGDVLEVKDGKLWVNGQPTDEPYVQTPMNYQLAPLTLKNDEYFLLGDSRNASHDSHVWGPLPGDHLIGPLKMRAWPLLRFDGP